MTFGNPKEPTLGAWLIASLKGQDTKPLPLLTLLQPDSVAVPITNSDDRSIIVEPTSCPECEQTGNQDSEHNGIAIYICPLKHRWGYTSEEQTHE